MNHLNRGAARPVKDLAHLASAAASMYVGKASRRRSRRGAGPNVWFFLRLWSICHLWSCRKTSPTAQISNTGHVQVLRYRLSAARACTAGDTRRQIDTLLASADAECE